MKFINLLWKDLKESFLNKKIWMFFTIVSVILIAGTYCAMREENQKADAMISIGLADEDSSYYSNMLVDYVKKSKEVSNYVDIVSGTEEEIKKLFENGKIVGYMVIPKNFVNNLISIENTPVKVFIGTENTTIAVLLNNTLKSYEKYISAVEVNCVGLYQIMEREQRSQTLTDKKNFEISMELVFLALGRNDLFEIHEISGARRQVSFSQYYIHSLIVMIFLFGSMFAGFSYLREKETKILIRLHLTGIAEWKYLVYKLILFCSVCSLALFLIYGIVKISAYTNTNFSIYVSYVMCMSECIVLSMLFAYFCKNTKIYMLVTGTVYFMLYIVGGGVIPMMYMPRALYIIGKYSPVYQMLQWLT